MSRTNAVGCVCAHAYPHTRAHNRFIKTFVFSWYHVHAYLRAVFLRKSFHLSSTKHVRGSITLDTEVH